MTSQQQVDAYITKKAAWSKEIVLLRSFFLKAKPNLEESIKWGAPVYSLNGKNIAGISAFKAYVGIWFFQGVFLKDSTRTLVNAQEGKTKAMRQWRFYSLAEIKENKKYIQQYISEAIKNQEAGKEIKPQRKKTVPMPKELKEFLSGNTKLQTAFKALTPGKQTEYKEYIQEAKMAATKLRRLEKISEMIMSGKGLHDKYK